MIEESPWLPNPMDLPPGARLLINPNGTRHLALIEDEGQWMRLWQDREAQPIGGDGAIRERPSDIGIIIKYSFLWAASRFPDDPRAGQLIDEVAAGAKQAVLHFAALAGERPVSRPWWTSRSADGEV